MPLEPLSPNNPAPPSLGSYLNTAYSVLLTLGALFAVGTFTVGGVIYMTSEAAGKKTEAVGRMKAALFGLLLLAASVLILQTVNPCLLTFNLGAVGGDGTCSSAALGTGGGPGETGGGASPSQSQPPPPAGTQTNGFTG